MGKCLKLGVLLTACVLAFGCAARQQQNSPQDETLRVERFRRSYEAAFDNKQQEASQQLISKARSALGTPYVSGGSSPGGFDCSGFVSYVYNNCGVGWSFGRLSAEGIRQICSYVSPADAKPGDLIFFEKTYNTTGASHIGIYVGNHTMLHCGDPIQYTSISSDYWQSHFLQFGRLAPP